MKPLLFDQHHFTFCKEWSERRKRLSSLTLSISPLTSQPYFRDADPSIGGYHPRPIPIVAINVRLEDVRQCEQKSRPAREGVSVDSDRPSRRLPSTDWAAGLLVPLALFRGRGNQGRPPRAPKGFIADWHGGERHTKGHTKKAHEKAHENSPGKWFTAHTHSTTVFLLVRAGRGAVASFRMEAQSRRMRRSAARNACHVAVVAQRYRLW